MRHCARWASPLILLEFKPSVIRQRVGREKNEKWGNVVNRNFGSTLLSTVIVALLMITVLLRDNKLTLWPPVCDVLGSFPSSICPRRMELSTVEVLLKHASALQSTWFFLSKQNIWQHYIFSKSYLFWNWLCCCSWNQM